MAGAFTFALRMAGPDDAELLWQAFLASRPTSHTALPEPLLRNQHRAREAAYAAGYPGLENCVIVTAGRPVGRLLVWWSDDECRVVDLVILPADRRQGLAGLVLASLVDEAKRAGKPLRATLPAENVTAQRLYHRLGFRLVSNDGASLAVEVPAPAS